MSDEAIRIPLLRRPGVVAYSLVDAADAALVLNGRAWRLHAVGYAFRHDYEAGETRRDAVMMHRLVMGLEKGDGLHVDHFNHDKLDNRRSNLRVVTVAENNQNLLALKGAVSRHRGVYRRKRDGAWIASVKFNGKAHFLGAFSNEDQAGRVASEWRAQNMPFSQDARRAA